MTLIAVYNSDGCVGRCDAKCYEAESPACECDCICGGMNHGRGQQRAIDNTRKYQEDWIQRYCKEKGIQYGKGEVSGEIYQMNLF